MVRNDADDLQQARVLVVELLTVLHRYDLLAGAGLGGAMRAYLHGALAALDAVGTQFVPLDRASASPASSG